MFAGTLTLSHPASFRAALPFVEDPMMKEQGLGGTYIDCVAIEGALDLHILHQPISKNTEYFNYSALRHFGAGKA